ncbi:MAG TPA: cytochrome c biogenesis protein CcsA [Steroidobacteraceae bacterium]|nr:cytochrome c biogenesis protein CcsA [Steroidobacteraceae bacterium]
MSGFLVILLYLAAAAAALHAARREAPRAAFHEPALYLAATGLAAHGAWLADTLAPAGGLSLSLADSASLMGLAIGAGGLFAVFAPRFRTVAAACLGVAALLAAGTGSLQASQEIAAGGWPLAVHVVLAMGSAGMFAIAAVLVILLSLQDAALRGGRSGGWLATLPPVESLERALFSVIGTGMAALTVAILAGLLFVTDLFAQHLVHKTVLALAAWAIFAFLLFGRWRFGWRGRTAARYTIAGFLVLAVAYFGSKFVLEILLGRHWG